MLCHKYHKTSIKKCIGSFIGSACISFFIGSCSDQALLGRGLGEEIAPTTLGSQAPSFQDDCTGRGSKPRPMPSSLLHPNPYTLHPVRDIPSQSILAENTPGINSPSGNTTFAPRTTSPLPSLSVLDQEFMTKVAQSDMTVIDTSRLALQKSKKPEVRDFARRMIDKHTDSCKQLMQIVKDKGFKLPENIGSDNQSLLMNLMQAPSDRFDREYIQRQIETHNNTYNEFQNYLKQGQDPKLKEFARKMSPVVTEHRDMARNILKRL